MNDLSLKTHYSAKELALFNLKGFPSAIKNILEKAKRENWQSRKREGRGGGLEYELASMPEDIQQEIKLKYAFSQPVPEQQTTPKPSLVKVLNSATEKERALAAEKAEAVRLVHCQLSVGIPLMQALQAVSSEKNLAIGSLKNWFYKVQGCMQHEWQAMLVRLSGKTKKSKATIDQEIWDIFLKLYLAKEQPSLADCYRKTVQIAKSMGIAYLPSKQSFQRKLMNDVPYTLQVYHREGANAVAKLVPALRRSVSDLYAMEWLNGDGYQHNVFVEFPNGEIGRPKTWFWQDVRTRKILGYRTAVSENTESIRHTLMDVIYHYGIPKAVTLDNTRAAANKALTGGVKNRYRFKHDELDPKGILPLLGIEVHFTQVLFGKGHGQAKPIERAFGRGGIGELVDKHPSLRGFYTGKSIDEKPDNYNGGKEGVKWDIFLQALANGVNDYNTQTNRRTEMCQGKLSFEEV